jgi:hypothetical protein
MTSLEALNDKYSKATLTSLKKNKGVRQVGYTLEEREARTNPL